MVRVVTSWKLSLLTCAQSVAQSRFTLCRGVSEARGSLDLARHTCAAALCDKIVSCDWQLQVCSGTFDKRKLCHKKDPLCFQSLTQGNATTADFYHSLLSSYNQQLCSCNVACWGCMCALVWMVYFGFLGVWQWKHPPRHLTPVCSPLHRKSADSAVMWRRSVLRSSSTRPAGILLFEL